MIYPRGHPRRTSSNLVNAVQRSTRTRGLRSAMPQITAPQQVSSFVCDAYVHAEHLISNEAMRRGRPGGTGPQTQFGHWATVPSDRTCCRRRAEGWGGHTRQRGAAATGGRPYLHSPACPSPVRPLEARCGGCVGVQAGVSMQGPAAMSSVAACLHSPACPSHVRPLEARCGGCVGVKAGPGSRPVRGGVF